MLFEIPLSYFLSSAMWKLCLKTALNVITFGEFMENFWNFLWIGQYKTFSKYSA
jgi:hypothetical protein